MQCVILAGGMATRMRPLTDNIPKLLIPVHGRPFAYHQLNWLKKKGVTEVLLSIGYLGDQIREYVGEGERFGLKVEYVDEGTELRGTGGALRLAFDEDKLQENFMVTYGDSFLTVDYQDVFSKFLFSGKSALMTVFQNNGKWDTSNVWFENHAVTLYDKYKKHPEHAGKLQYIDYGLSAMKREVVEERISSNTKSDLADLFYQLSREGELEGCLVKERFYEIGSPEGLSDFTKYVSNIASR
jgi:NDP-sugar pyrophosphorylase family protein